MKDWQLLVVSTLAGAAGALASASYYDRRREQFERDLRRQSEQLERLAAEQAKPRRTGPPSRPRPPAPSPGRHVLRDDDIRTTTTPAQTGVLYAPGTFDGRIDGGPERSWAPHVDADSSDSGDTGDRSWQMDPSPAPSSDAGSTGGGGWGGGGSDSGGSTSSGSDGGGGGGGD